MHEEEIDTTGGRTETVDQAGQEDKIICFVVTDRVRRRTHILAVIQSPD